MSHCVRCVKTVPLGIIILNRVCASSMPPMVGFATGKQSHTGKQVRETGKVIVTVPGESLAQTVMACGASTGAKTDKVAANNIEMMAVEGSDIQIPS